VSEIRKVHDRGRCTARRAAVSVTLALFLLPCLIAARADDLRSAGEAALRAQSPKSDLAAGFEAYLNGQYADAAQHLAGPLKAGNADAEFLIGTLYLNGTGEAKDTGEGIRLLRLAAAQHNASAEDQLGNCYVFGTGVAKDMGEARRWFERGTADGDIDTMYELGYLLQTQGDKDAAAPWIQKAAESGEPRAQVLYGDSFRFGNGSPTGLREAAHWYLEAAKQGDPVGMVKVAEVFDLGIGGVMLDYQTTTRLYEAAAKQGYDFAQYKLGQCYETGHGVAADNTTALKWFRLAAEQGLPAAMIEAAHLLEASTDPSDKAEALKWYQGGAERGSPLAMHNLARLYASGGSGVPRDLAKAYYWAQLALRFYAPNNGNAARLRTHLVAALEMRLPASTKQRVADEVRAFTPLVEIHLPPVPQRVWMLAHIREVAGLASSTRSDPH